MWTVFRQQLGAPGTVRTALVVGTLINLYGHVLVPWLRGADAVGAFGRSFEEVPVVTLLSVALGFAFPWFVSAYAGARARVEIGAATSLARFPDLKPDPVFRADRTGALIEAGARTRVMFERHRIARAQDILGADVWARVTEAVRRDGRLSVPESAYFEPAGQWYVVTAAEAPDGINVYLSVVPGGGARHTGRPPDQSSA